MKKKPDVDLQDLVKLAEEGGDGVGRDWLLQQIKGFYCVALKKGHFSVAFNALKLMVQVEKGGRMPGGDKGKVERVGKISSHVLETTEGVRDAHGFLEKQASTDEADSSKS